MVTGSNRYEVAKDARVTDHAMKDQGWFMQPPGPASWQSLPRLQGRIESEAIAPAKRTAASDGRPHGRESAGRGSRHC